MPTAIAAHFLAHVCEEVRVIASEGERDPEMAHSREDNLREEVLRHIASGLFTKDDAVAFAKAVLKTKNASFVRWSA